jgi:hypothetical protein
MREPLKSAVIALAITVPVLLFGFFFSFGLAHSVSIGLALTYLVYWPVMLTFATPGLEAASEAGAFIAASTAEYLYIFLVIRFSSWAVGKIRPNNSL